MAGFCCKFLRLAGVVALPCLALMSGAAMAEAQQAPAFDTSLPADYERSKLTDQINAYLDSLPKENVSEADLQQLQQLRLALMSGAAMAEAQKAPAFDTSLPADYERCKLTDQINAYLDSLPKENVSEADLQQLQQLQQFLLQCQDLMKQQIEENQTMLDNLQSQSKGAAK